MYLINCVHCWNAFTHERFVDLKLFRWSAIAARLPGRTDNEIKNYWNTHIRKRLLRMGIDPVTHTPRFDLLDLSSLLNPSMYNPAHQLELSRLLGLEPLVNSELLRMATDLLSASHHQNPNLPLAQNLSQPNFSHTQEPNTVLSSLQPQIPQSLAQEVPPSTNPSAQFLDEVQLIQANVGQFTNEAHNNMSIQDMLEQARLLEMHQPYDTSAYDSWDPSILQMVNNSDSRGFTGYHDYNLDSVLSTPDSSSTPLNSSSTHINSSVEDERESYCSNMFKFQIPGLLDVSDYM